MAHDTYAEATTARLGQEVWRVCWRGRIQIGGRIELESIKASEQNLDSVFHRDYEFRIPVYQRPYAWDLEQVGELFDDLATAMDRGGDEPYFLGSIVLIKRGENPTSDVVDGQQRLTTLTMLLCVLRELTDGEWPGSLDDRIRQRADVAMSRTEVVRLRLRERDQGFFHTHVQSKGGLGSLINGNTSTNTNSQERIVENAGYLYREVEKLTPDQRVQLARFLIGRCYLVVVTTNSQSSAYRIFAVMNDRGLNLTPTDILKAEVTGAIDDEASRSTYAQKWEAVEEELGRDRFENLFSHVRMVYSKDKLRRNLQDAFRDQVLSTVRSDEFVDNVLLPYSEAYGKAVGLDDGVPDGVKPYLKHLSHLDNVDWIPPVMELFIEPPTESGHFIEFVAGIEALAYGLFVLRANVNERIARFAAVITAIQSRNQDEVRASLALSEAEKQRIVSTLDGPIYEMTRVRMPLLLRLDGLLAGAEATYDHPIITIEHVLPQSPNGESQWMEWFPEEEERASWTHRLANLVLLSRRKNARASNFEFNRKKDEYFKRDGFPPFPLTMPVLSETEWTPVVLEARQEMLLARLKEAWELDAGTPVDV